GLRDGWDVGRGGREKPKRPKVEKIVKFCFRAVLGHPVQKYARDREPADSPKDGPFQ
ncbi:hypothetical protein KI387_014510, partial [Taxus chinensis]